MTLKNKLELIYNCIVVLIRKRDIRCEIPLSTRFNHSGLGTVIGKGVVLGENCIIGAGVIIGAQGKKYPHIGCNCIICTHATIIGGIIVGHHSVIGAGAVVIQDIPPYSLVVGVPAKVIKTITQEKYEVYWDERR
jgi:serine O-acetyltransferase